MMTIRKILPLFAAVFMAFASASARTVLLPFEMEGSMMPYDFSRSSQTAVWADTLTPVYVAHVARHGARYITSEKKLERLKAAIAKAEAKGTITNKGRDFARLLRQVEQTTGQHWGDLSEVGCREEATIARELSSLVPKLLKDGKITALSSYVPRVVKTMYEYCRELALLHPDIEITAGEGKRYDFLVRCFTVDTAYAAYRKHGNWEQVYDRIADSLVPTRPALELLGPNACIPEKELRSLTLDMYDVLQSLRAAGMQAPDDRFMTADEYRRCWETDNLLHYLRNTVTPLSTLAGKASSPLLARIIADADNALGNRLMRETATTADLGSIPDSQVAATLYFGHAETLMPLLSLMKVPGCYDDSGDFATLSERWKDYEVVPLGANLDIIMLGAPSGATYVAVRLNGRFIAPMPDGRLTPTWNDYRRYLTGIMLSLR